MPRPAGRPRFRPSRLGPISRNRTFGSLLTFAVLAGCAGPYPPPPDTPTDPVTDTIHGVEIVDEYRWLEDQDAPETRTWIEAQNAYAETVVGPSPLRDSIRARLRELMDRPDVGGTQEAGGHQYFTMRRVGEELPRVYRRPVADTVDGEPGPDGEYEVVLDPAAFDSTYRTQVSLRDLSPDGEVMMYQIRRGGADEVEIRFRDTETLEDLPDRLPRALYGGVRFTEDGRAVEYTRRSREAGPRILRHVLGTSLEEDELIWGEGYGPTAFIGMDVVADGRWRIFTAQHGWARNEVWIQGAERDSAVRPVVTDVPAHFDTEFHEGTLYLVTDWRAPLARVVAVDPERPEPERWETVLPEADRPLHEIAFLDGRIYATYLDDVAQRIRVFEMDGTPAGEVELQPFSSADIRSDGEGRARLTVEGHLRPEVEYTLDLATGERTVSDSSDVPFDPAGFRVEQRWFTSRDGTRAPMYVLHRQGIELDGSHPTILTGYGGFDAANLPGFSTTAAVWLERGGVWAVATLRGGSEYGEEWHRDGMLENKQHVFDDFIAASERLIELGYTSPERLGIRGASNGGLLVAAAMTQRPELYRAVLCGYPDLDMVRFHAFTETNNMPALLEYGNAADPEQFEAIRRYSPYQAVEDGVDYPAVMLSTGDLDTRVPPLQARKMTARLQAATGSGLPVILWYDPMGGHAAGRGRPMSLRIEDTARELAFMAEQLGLVPDG